MTDDLVAMTLFWIAASIFVAAAVPFVIWMWHDDLLTTLRALSQE
jgi:hypothetical protein